MIRIGITGGIGSGKSTICNIFKVLGVHVFHADNVARDIQETENKIRSGLTDLFGSSIYSREGILDRKTMAGLIFNNPALMKEVSRIIHPVVRENFLSWADKHHNEDYILYEAAILFETGYYKDLDYNILVVADEKIRIKRVMKRDNTPVEAVMERIKNQMQDEEKIRMADFVIDNNERDLVIPQVLKINDLFKKHG